MVIQMQEISNGLSPSSEEVSQVGLVFFYLVTTGSKAVHAQKSSLHDILVKACLFLLVLQLQVLLVRL